MEHPALSVWCNMHRRTSGKGDPRNRSYKSASMCEEWQTYEGFLPWYLKYPGQKIGFELDKDLLGLGSKTYSPETCCFLPPSINKMLTSRRSDSGKHPGVWAHKGKYIARARHRGLQNTLGRFYTPEEAYEVYVDHKIKILREEAVMFKNSLPDFVFEGLMCFDYRAQQSDDQHD